LGERGKDGVDTEWTSFLILYEDSHKKLLGLGGSTISFLTALLIEKK
jgi:hypothetical protein